MPIFDKGFVAVGGTVLTYKENNVLSEFADFGEFLRKPVTNKEGITNVITANCAFLKSTFDEVGGFYEELHVAAEDLDFTYKLSLAGYRNRFFYAVDAVVFHKHRTKFKNFIKQQFGYGFGAVSHCILRKRNPLEIGFLFPTPINYIKYAVTHFFVSIALIPKIDIKYGILNKLFLFPVLNFIREVTVLTGGAKAYYTQKR
jgi:GT2 family glycosyltransferase